ncbi:MAG TPA: allophanate hydrolase subunit 1 [Acidimicrobiales bacterium]|nr:allophanate hydrolase subunit 1 [Acidimicrobiales bacterium]
MNDSRPVGRRALLLTAAHPAGAAASLAAAAGRAGLDLDDVVPGAETVLVVARRAADRPLVTALLGEVVDAPLPPEVATAVEVPVRYDGPDLEAVAAATGLSADGVVAAHSGAVYTGAFSGFAPGFCYLEGLPAELRVARRDEPRTAVPPGSVAIAERYSAVYPRRSPGGWQLLGRTDAALWDPTRSPPALLRPGTLVRFRPE